MTLNKMYHWVPRIIRGLSLADTAGNIYYARRRVNEDFLNALHADFLEHGREIIRRAGQEQPGTYLKVLAQLVPKELQVEHSGSVISKLSDEQLSAMIAALDVQMQEALAIANGENAKVINAQAEPAAKEWIAPAPGAPIINPTPKARRENWIMPASTPASGGQR